MRQNSLVFKKSNLQHLSDLNACNFVIISLYIINRFRRRRCVKNREGGGGGGGEGGGG